MNSRWFLLTALALFLVVTMSGCGSSASPFALQDGSLVLIMSTMGSSMYDRSKKQKGFVKEQVSGISILSVILGFIPFLLLHSSTPVARPRRKW